MFGIALAVSAVFMAVALSAIGLVVWAYHR
jgi:hypothetical protein